MNELTVFNFNDNPIRTQYFDNQAWFCLKDICAIFGLANLAMIKRRLNTKGVNLIDTLTKGGRQKLLYVNEPNLYRVAFRSDKPLAEPFIDWVAEEVLPSIRRTGVYACGEVAVKEHMRSKPSGKKEIVLSEKAKTENGGIVKACAPKALSDEDKRSLAEMVAAKVSTNLMYLKRDELATQALALRRQAEIYDEVVREYDRNLAKIEKALI